VSYLLPKTSRKFALLVALGFCLLSGCSSVSIPVPWRKVPLDASTGFYQSASLTYHLDAGKLQQPLHVARIAEQKVSYEQLASSPLPEQSVGTLTLTYPHPGGRTGFAQAKFSLDSARPESKKKSSSWNPWSKKPATPAPTALSGNQAEVHELWTLDLPAAESDGYFKVLSSHSFYNTERGTQGGVRLSVNINGSQISKQWDQIPELNQLIQRIRSQGQLVEYRRPAALQGAQEAISSTVVYAQLIAQTGTADFSSNANSPAAAIPNAFAVTAPPAMQPAANEPVMAQRPGLVR